MVEGWGRIVGVWFMSGILVVVAPVPGQESQPQPTEEPADQNVEEPPTIDVKVADFERREGLLTIHLDHRKGAIWLELSAPQSDRGEIGQYIYVEGLLSGLGSNPVGLDRGQLGASRLVTIRRVGGRVFVEQENLAFRALSEDSDERRAVRQSFATSVLWAGEIDIEDPDGRLLVDFTSFVVRDAHNTAATLKRSKQGSFRLDEKRSALDGANCLGFPDNIELEAVLTFAGTEPGGFVRSTAPTANAITLVQHHSFIRLPDDEYQTRRFDPRVASGATSFLDYASSLDEPLAKRWIRRHRLEKVDPSAARSAVVEPIVYYIDRGAPEPVRSALMEGGSWWAEAFDRAGFIDAYRVELLPEDAHPLDVRYNVVQWVHRSTRGWSYGGSVSDPRTGEIIKGHVSLGSLRVRQDILIFEGLAGVTQTGTGAADDPVELALARIRQLAAHEIGHTLGFAHNFAASTYGGRASVMDYPAPLIGVRDDSLDFSDVYGVGVGVWDIHSVRYAYTQFPPGTDEDAELDRIVRAGLDRGYLFMSDSDARPLGSAHPQAHLWDNGDDAVAALRHTMQVRNIALDGFGERNIKPGRPLTLLHEVLVPVYLHHRFQLEAATKIVGGLEYSYAVRGDGQDPTRPIDAARQREALDTVLACVQPAFLDLPEDVLRLLQPRAFGFGGNRELFVSSTSPGFDALGAAESAARMAVGGLLQPQRCGRLVDFARRDSGQLSLEDMLKRLVDAAFESPANESPRHAQIRSALQHVVVVGLIDLALNGSAPASVRSAVDEALAALRNRLTDERVRVAGEHLSLVGLIDRYLDRELSGPRSPARARPMPPGSPIGASLGGGDDWCGSSGSEARWMELHARPPD